MTILPAYALYVSISLLLLTAIPLFWRLGLAHAATQRLAPEISQALEQDDLTAAREVALKYKRSHLSAPLAEGFAVLQRHIAELPPDTEDLAVRFFERTLTREIALAAVIAKKGITTVEGLSAISAVLGALMGTRHGSVLGGAATLTAVLVLMYSKSRAEQADAELRYTTNELISFIEEKFLIPRARRLDAAR